MWRDTTYVRSFPHGDADAVRILLRHGAPVVGMQDRQQRTALHVKRIKRDRATKGDRRGGMQRAWEQSKRLGYAATCPQNHAREASIAQHNRDAV